MPDSNCEKCAHFDVCDRSSRLIWVRLSREKVCTDFLEVVRCADCVFCDQDTPFCRHASGLFDIGLTDFCSFGRRQAPDENL